MGLFSVLALTDQTISPKSNNKPIGFPGLRGVWVWGYYGVCVSTYITEKPTPKSCCSGTLQGLQGACELVSSPQQLVTLI